MLYPSGPHTCLIFLGAGYVVLLKICYYLKGKQRNVCRMSASQGLSELELAIRQLQRLEIDFIWKELFQSDLIKESGVL